MNYHNPSIEDILISQSQGMDIANFRCDTCINYEGDLKCDKGVFIAFTGANLNNCHAYKLGKKCPHCGRIG